MEGMEGMFRFSKAKIYEIRCRNTGLCYIGSTTKSLEERLSRHENSYRFWKLHGINYRSSFEILEGGNYEIYLLEYFPCDFKEELHHREGLWQRKIRCVNQRIAGRTTKQYYQENKEAVRAKNVEYRNNNQNHLNQKRREHRQENYDKVLEKEREYAAINKERITEYKKQYHESNREQILEKKRIYNKNHYELNRDKILEKQKVSKKKYCQKRILCDCGSNVVRNNLSRHMKSKKHLLWLEHQNTRKNFSMGDTPAKQISDEVL